MKKNIVKTLLKAFVITVMIGVMFIGGDKLTVKADEMDDWCAMQGITLEQLADNMMDPAYADKYFEFVFAQQGLNYDEEAAKAVAALEAEGFFDSMPTLETVTTARKDMLAKVNADRKANGAGNLAWDAELEVAARQRAIEVMSNVQTEEFTKAYNSGDTNKINEIVHKGYILKENAIVSWTSGVDSKTANDNWMASEGHHSQRIRAGWTKYACASYTDPVTNMEIWMEVFADNSFKGVSSFDYIRYAADYPDLAAAFGQDKNALYNHYLTNGKIEGRKAYYTDGTAIE